MQTLPAPAAREQPSGSDRSLADLIEQVALGHREAFGELYSRTSWKVFGLCNAIIRDVGHAEEVTQEVFLEIWQRALGLEHGRTHLSTFGLHAHERDRAAAACLGVQAELTASPTR